MLECSERYSLRVAIVLILAGLVDISLLHAGAAVNITHNLSTKPIYHFIRIIKFSSALGYGAGDPRTPQLDLIK